MSSLPSAVIPARSASPRGFGTWSWGRAEGVPGGAPPAAPALPAQRQRQEPGPAAQGGESWKAERSTRGGPECAAGGPGGGLQAPGWAPAALFGSDFFLSGSPGIRFPGGECHLRAHPAPSACSCRAGGGPQRLSHPTACRGACPKREPESNAGMLPRGSRGLFSPAPASLGIYFHLGCFNIEVMEGNWKQIWVERGSCRVMPGFCFLAPWCSWAHASSVTNADTGRAGGAGAGGASPHGGTSPHSGAAQQQGAGGGSRILTAGPSWEGEPPGDESQDVSHRQHFERLLR